MILIDIHQNAPFLYLNNSISIALRIENDLYGELFKQ